MEINGRRGIFAEDFPKLLDDALEATAWPEQARLLIDQRYVDGLLTEVTGAWPTLRHPDASDPLRYVYRGITFADRSVAVLVFGALALPDDRHIVIASVQARGLS